MQRSGEVRLPRQIVDAIHNFTANRKFDRPISVSTIVRTIRYARPDLNIGDRDLADAVAEQLIACGCVLDFDSGEKSPDSRRERSMAV